MYFHFLFYLKNIFYCNIIMELTKVFASKNKDDNINESKKPKITKNRSTKKDLYKKEQEDILNKINTILGISKDNNTIYLYDIENDDDKKNQILALSDDIQKYFKAGNWSFYRDEECKGNHVLLCKSIYKDMGYQIIGKAVDITRNNDKIRTTKYIIGKININL